MKTYCPTRYKEQMRELSISHDADYERLESMCQLRVRDISARFPEWIVEVISQSHGGWTVIGIGSSSKNAKDSAVSGVTGCNILSGKDQFGRMKA